jgi:endonuclease/exonuclease/phosphatase family metal-dependent hydrolase
MGKVESGIALFGKGKPATSQRIGFDGNYGWPTRLFMLDRCFILNSYEVKGERELVIINTHNSAFDDGDLRRDQLEALRSVMLEEYGRGNYVIAGGDWNMNPEGFLVYLCKTGDMHFEIEPRIEPGYFPEGWTWAFDQEVPTNRFLIESYLRGRTPTTTIDYFVLSPNIELLEITTEDLFFENSDHNPVSVKVRLD